MSLRTPIVVAVALLSALGGVALAAVAMPASPSRPTPAAAAVAPSPTPEVRTETVHRTIHIVRREHSRSAPRAASRARAAATPAAAPPAPAAIAPRPAEPARYRGARPSDGAVGDDRGADANTGVQIADDSGHHGDDASGHRGDDDHGGRGRGGDDD